MIVRFTKLHLLVTVSALLVGLGVLACVTLTGPKQRIVDKMDYPFVNDPQALGRWQSVDFVKQIEDYQPGKKQWQGELFLKDLTFLEGGKTPKEWETWTKGIVMHSGDKTASHYEIKDLNGTPTMFFEWKSGDYTIRHQKPEYYVLTKATGQAEAGAGDGVEAGTGGALASSGTDQAAGAHANTGTGRVGQAEAEKVVKASQEVVDLLAKGKDDEVAKLFDAQMTKALTPAKLGQGWQAVSAQAGAFQKPLEARVQSLPPNTRVIVTCQFQKNPVDVVVVWNEKGQIAGLFLQPAGKEIQKPELEQAARELVGQLAGGQFEQATARFDPTMKAALTADQLKAAWQGLASEYGALREIRDTRSEELLGKPVVYVTARFEKGAVEVKVVFDQDKQVGGLWMAPEGK